MLARGARPRQLAACAPWRRSCCARWPRCRPCCWPARWRARCPPPARCRASARPCGAAAAAAWLAGTATLAGYAAQRPVDTERTRGNAVLGLGAEIALVVLGVLALWELASHGPAEAARGLVDPVVVLAPAVAVLACAVLSLRLIPLAGRAMQALAARARSWAAPYGAWSAARAGRASAGPVVLLVMAIGTVVLAGELFLRLAAFRLGPGRLQRRRGRADLRRGRPGDGRRRRPGRAARGDRGGRSDQAERVHRRRRLRGRHPDPGGRSGRLAQAGRLRADLGPGGIQGLTQPLMAAADSGQIAAEPGLALPGEPRTVELELALTGAASSGGSLQLTFAAAAGEPVSLYVPVPAGATAQVQLPLSRVVGSGAEVAWPLRLTRLNLLIPQPGHGAASAAGLQIRGVTADGKGVTLPPSQSWNMTTSQEQGTAVLSAIATPRTSAESIGAVATSGFLAASGKQIGDTAVVLIGGASIPVHIYGEARAIPTVAPSADGLLLDRADVDAYALRTGSGVVGTLEWWLTAQPSRIDAVAAAAAELPGLGGTVQDRLAVRADYAADPVRSGPAGALRIAAVAVALLALIGFATRLANELRSRAREIAIARALGLDPAGWPWPSASSRPSKRCWRCSAAAWSARSWPTGSCRSPSSPGTARPPCPCRSRSRPGPRPSAAPAWPRSACSPRPAASAGGGPALHQHPAAHRVGGEPMTPARTRRPRTAARLEAHALWRSAGAVRGPLAVLALLAFVLSGSMIAGDRLVTAHTTDAYRSYLGAQSAGQTDLTAASTMTSASAATLAQATARTSALLPAGLVGAVSPIHTAVVGQGGVWRKPLQISRQTVIWAPELSPVYSPQATASAHYVQGSAPACPAGGCTATSPMPIAVAQPVAAALGLSVGRQLILDASNAANPLTVRVSGIFTGSGAGFDDLGTLLKPRLAEWVPQMGEYAGVANTQWDAEVLIDPAALPLVTHQPAQVTWRYHLRPNVLAGSAAAGLSAEIKSRISSANILGLGNAFSDDVFSSHLAPTLDAFATLDAAANALADFALAGTAAIALAVLFLAIRILAGPAGHRRGPAASARRLRDGARGLDRLPGPAGVRAGHRPRGGTLPGSDIRVRSGLRPRRPAVGGGGGHRVRRAAAGRAGGGPGPAAGPALAPPPHRLVDRARHRAAGRPGRGGGRADARGRRRRRPADRAATHRAGRGRRRRHQHADPAGGAPGRPAGRPRPRPGRLPVRGRRRPPPHRRPGHRGRADRRGHRRRVRLLLHRHPGRRPGHPVLAEHGRGPADQLHRGPRRRARPGRAGEGGRRPRHRGARRGPRCTAPSRCWCRRAGSRSPSTCSTRPSTPRPDPGHPLETPAADAELDTLGSAHGAAGTVPVLASPDLLGLLRALPADSPGTLSLSGDTLDLSVLGSAAAFPPAGGSGSVLVLSAAGLRQAMPNFQIGATVAWYTYRPGVTAAPAVAGKVPAAVLASRAAAIGGYGSDLLSALSAWISRSAGLLDVLLAAACVLLAAAATARARAASSAFLLTMGTRRRAAATGPVLETVPMLAAVGVAAIAAGYGATQALLRPWPRSAACRSPPPPPCPPEPCSRPRPCRCSACWSPPRAPDSAARHSFPSNEQAGEAGDAEPTEPTRGGRGPAHRGLRRGRARSCATTWCGSTRSNRSRCRHCRDSTCWSRKAR